MKYTETQPLELTRGLTHICCQISSLSPAGLSYDPQCHQWFTGKLNCFMDTHLSSSAGQSTEATHSAVKWSLSDILMSNPDCVVCHSDRCKKVKKAYYWTIEPLSKFEFGGGETVIKTAESKNKFMISWREARLIFCQSQSSYGMARFKNVKVQAARKWLLTPWVACERLILNSVDDGAAGERQDMERVEPHLLTSDPDYIPIC